MINYIEGVLDPTIDEDDEFILNHNLIGIASQFDPTTKVGNIILPRSESEQIYINTNFCKFIKGEKITDSEEIARYSRRSVRDTESHEPPASISEPLLII